MKEWPDESHLGIQSSVAWGAPVEPHAPASLGRYVLHERLGKGGQGWVYRAFDLHLEREVALKILHGGASPVHQQVARLQHPNIVSLHDAGTLPDGRAFLAMELYAGRTLADHIADHAGLGLLTHVLQACQAVAMAHEQGLVHQDLKPSNILVGRFEETQVADWGLAARSGSTRTRFTGSRLYASPNHLALGPVDPRDDVWALGCVLLQAVTGTHPFVGATVEGLPARQAAVRVPEGLPPELRTILQGCFAGTYHDAASLTEDLLRYTRGQRLSRHDYTFSQLLRRFLLTHRDAVAVAALTGVVLALLTAEAGRRVWQSRQETRIERGRAIFAGLDRFPSQPPSPEMLKRLRTAAELWPGPETTGLLVGHHEALSLTPPELVPHGLLDCEQRVFQYGRPLCVNAGRATFADGTAIVGRGRWDRHIHSDEGYFRNERGSTWRGEPEREGSPIVHDGQVTWLGVRHELETPWGVWAPCGPGLVRQTIDFAGTSGWAVCRDRTVVTRQADGSQRRWHDPGGAFVFQLTAVDADRALIGREDGTVELLHVDREHVVWSAPLPIGQITQILHRGSWVVAQGIRGAVVLDVSTGSPLRWLPEAGGTYQLTDEGVERLTAEVVERWSIPERGSVTRVSQGSNAIDLDIDGRLAIASGRDLLVQHPDGRVTTLLDDVLPNVVKDTYWSGGDLYTVVPYPAEPMVFEGPRFSPRSREVLGFGQAARAVDGTHYTLAYGSFLSWGTGLDGIADVVDLAEGPWALGASGQVWELTEDGPVERFRAEDAVGIEGAGEMRIVHTADGGRRVDAEGETICQWSDGGSLSSAVAPDRIALGYLDGGVRLLDGACETVFVAHLHAARVADLLFDGEVLVSASWDRTVRRWPLEALDD